MPVIHIVTPCSRPENLGKMLHSISIHMPWHMNFKWWIVFDADEVPSGVENLCHHELHAIKGGVAGHKQRNYALDRIRDGYVYQLDDDNILHSEFGYVLRLVTAYYRKSAIFAQDLGNGRIRVNDATNIKQTHIDQAQFLLKREHIGNTRYVESDYCADGLFIEQIFHRQPENFIITDKVACYYNYLRR